VKLCALKLWLMIGNHRFVRDYDVGGEAELIGRIHHIGVPFGIVLGVGGLGLWVLWRRARQVRAERAKVLALLLIVLGQVIAIGIANVLIFTSAQNRVPLYVPLAFVAGPALEAVLSKLRKRPSRFELTPLAVAFGVLLAAQSFWPRTVPPKRPSSAHYYNLAAVEEKLGRLEDAAGHFARAVQQNPRQPMFHVSLARVLRRMGRFDEARAALDRIIGMPNVPGDVYQLAHRERGLIIREIQDAPADGASMR
jgi:tetratricopeptide (TPR) repeat protein